MEQDRKEWKFKSKRLYQRDYGASGAYFVTICSYQRQPCFKTPKLEQILKQQWQALPQRFLGIQLDAFVIMPDHLHFIVWINASIPSSPTLPQIVGAYKSLSAGEWLRYLKETDTTSVGRSGKKAITTALFVTKRNSNGHVVISKTILLLDKLHYPQQGDRKGRDGINPSSTHLSRTQRADV